MEKRLIGKVLRSCPDVAWAAFDILKEQNPQQVIPCVLDVLREKLLPRDCYNVEVFNNLLSKYVEKHLPTETKEEYIRLFIDYRQSLPDDLRVYLYPSHLVVESPLFFPVIVQEQHEGLLAHYMVAHGGLISDELVQLLSARPNKSMCDLLWYIDIDSFPPEEREQIISTVRSMPCSKSRAILALRLVPEFIHEMSSWIKEALQDADETVGWPLLRWLRWSFGDEYRKQVLQYIRQNYPEYFDRYLLFDQYYQLLFTGQVNMGVKSRVVANEYEKSCGEFGCGRRWNIEYTERLNGFARDYYKRGRDISGGTGSIAVVENNVKYRVAGPLLVEGEVYSSGRIYPAADKYYPAVLQGRTVGIVKQEKKSDSSFYHYSTFYTEHTSISEGGIVINEFILREEMSGSVHDHSSSSNNDKVSVAIFQVQPGGIIKVRRYGHIRKKGWGHPVDCDKDWERQETVEVLNRGIISYQRGEGLILL